MPWTRKQVRYLLSDKVSPLSGAEKAKMKSELHANPSIGHKKKGSKALKRTSTKRSRSDSNAYIAGRRA